MSRRGPKLSTIIGRSIRAAARESDRQYKQALREEKVREKEYHKQMILNEKISNLEQACNVKMQVECELLEYLSLKSPSNVTGQESLLECKEKICIM